MSREALVILVPAAIILVAVLIMMYSRDDDVEEAPEIPADDEEISFRRVWFYRPEWYWYGFRTLIPFSYGHDEFACRVLVFGWSFTGQVCIAVWGCGDPECQADAERYIREIRGGDDG